MPSSQRISSLIMFYCLDIVPVLEFQKNKMQNQDCKYAIGFSYINGVGRVRLNLLESYFGNLESAWHASKEALVSAGLDNSLAENIVTSRPKIDLPKTLETLKRHDIQVFTHTDSDYPARLRQIHDYPPLIFVKGQLLGNDELCLGIVGTRQPTVYGKLVTEELAESLARSGLTIVSGLARGIDTVAHTAALKAGGRSIAVFGCGLDIIYPSENSCLARQIAENGALVSEHPPGIRPRPEFFPRRNRILSGLCRGILVTEAGENSGAVITANFALEQNREIFAVPGSILSAASVGTNRLIQEGAKLVCSAKDVLEELNIGLLSVPDNTTKAIPENQAESLILDKLGYEPIHIDQICRECGLGIALVSSTLAMMELRGQVRSAGGMNYVRTREKKEIYQLEMN